MKYDSKVLTLKIPIATTADNIVKYQFFFIFQRKQDNVSDELSAS